VTSIKAGVIGVGFIGPVHVEALRRLGDVEVIAVAGARPGSTQAKAAELAVPRAYDNWRDGGKMPNDPTWPTFEAGFQANVVADAILQSAKEQRWVAIEY